MTIKENIEVVLKKGNAEGDDDIYSNVLDGVLSWIKDQTLNYRYNELKTTIEIPVSQGQKEVDLPDDYCKIENIVLLKSGTQYFLTINDIKDYDYLSKTDVVGIPSSIFLDLSNRKIYLYPVPNSDCVLRLRYYKFLNNLTENDSVFFSDKIIQQVAYIYLLQYDRIDSTTEELKLEKMLNDFKKNVLDTDGNTRINFDKNVFRVGRKYRFQL